GRDLRRLAAVVAGADDPGRDDMLARLLAEGEVLTLARRLRADTDAVSLAGGLRRDRPPFAVEGDLEPGGDLQRLQFPHFHGWRPPHWTFVHVYCIVDGRGFRVNDFVDKKR